MMCELGVGVARLYEAANLLVCRKQWPVFDGLEFLGRNKAFVSGHSVA
jgi:hypothetical protein